MQPAGAEVVQNLILPASTATASALLGARMSLPSWVPLRRGSPKSSCTCTGPDDGEDDLAATLLRLGELRAAADAAGVGPGCAASGPSGRSRESRERPLGLSSGGVALGSGSRSKGGTLAQVPARFGLRACASALDVPAAMKIAVCVKEVPERRAPKRIDPATKRLDRSGEGALNAFDVARGRGGAARQGGRAATARSCSSRSGPAKALDVAAQGARDGRRPRGARQRRRGRRLRPRRDEPRARDGARARGRRPRPLRPAGERLRRRRPLGRGRRPPAPAARLAGGRADGRRRQGDA